MKLRGLYAITDSELLKGKLLPYVEAALKGNHTTNSTCSNNMTRIKTCSTYMRTICSSNCICRIFYKRYTWTN